jgi:hypothetical protein
LDSLSRNHEKLFADWKKCPIIRLSMSDFNYMQDGNIQHLANQIKYYVADIVYPLVSATQKVLNI